MQYNGGIWNYRLDIVSFSRNHLDNLFGDNSEYYGKLKQRLKQVLPANLSEVYVNKEGKCNLYESSALLPFNFDNKTVKKVDKYMQNNLEDFQMGYLFFRKLTVAIGKDLEINDLPTVPLDSLLNAILASTML